MDYTVIAISSILVFSVAMQLLCCVVAWLFKMPYLAVISFAILSGTAFACSVFSFLPISIALELATLVGGMVSVVSYLLCRAVFTKSFC